jgi:hypothetical protein
MVFRPLSSDQIDEFLERGWTLLQHAFPAEVAKAVRRDLGERIGIELEMPQHWTQPRVWLQEMMRRPLYTNALTQRFCSAVNQLVGPGRWRITKEMGWWPITFPGFDAPPYRDDWHIDGGWFRHHLYYPEQALVNLFCFSTVGAGDGGTLARRGALTVWPPASFGTRSPTGWTPTISMNRSPPSLSGRLGPEWSKWSPRRATWC